MVRRVFVASSLALVGLTYLLLAASLRQYDREIIGTALVQYATAYQAGGVAGLQRRDPADAGDGRARAAARPRRSARARR